MAGVKHDPIADIGLISDNLRDRYKTGFPILKEIVQNADDAGGSHLSFGYSEGLPDAEHELLKGPAVFFINDGPLAETDADAILSIALGSKASNENAIGKFGLGMKSLFHLCEAFFYLSDQWETGENYHSDIFNPWGNLRELWENFNQNDKQLIQQQLAPVINQLEVNTKKQTWFIVWVPLRKRHSHYDGSIIEEYPGDKQTPPDFIAEKNVDVELGQLLPLLKGLNGLSIWQPDPNNLKNLQCTSTIILSDNAVRRQFHAPIVNSKLEGKVLLKSDNREDQIEYAGYECLLSEDKFQGIRSSEFWPKSYERDKDTNKEKKVEDKAKPHIAIVICQRRAEERANSHIDWAVFLPLGAYLQTERSYWVNENDKYHTQIFIHGYFFIDAGRVHIHGLDSIGEPYGAIENNDQVRSQWNSLLATDGCLSYLPEAIQNFVEAHKCSAERTQHLSEAVFKSDFVRQYRRWISQRYQWIYQLKADEKSWRLVSAELNALPLATYPKTEQVRAWSVLPKLAELSGNGHVFYDQSQVSLLNDSNGGWSEELIINVLDIDIAAIFCERTHLTYFNDFLSLEEIQQTEVVKARLLLIARKGLELSSDKLFKAGMTRFLEFIPPGQRVVLNKVKINGLWKQLAKIEPRLLIIPKEIAPEAEKKILLTVDDARLLLEALDTVLCNESLHKYHDEAQSLVVEIIGLVALTDKERLLKDCFDFRLFKIHDLAKGKDRFFAKSGLIAIQEHRSLFRFSSGLGDERFGHGRALFQALAGCDFYYIGKENRDLAFGKHVNIPECDSKACLNYINSKKPLLAPTKSRKKLLNKLSSSEFGLVEKRAFRYLLHGNLDHYDNKNEVLLTVATDVNDVWEKLTRAIYKSRHDDWRLIDQILSEDLSEKNSNELAINKLDIVKIIEALKQQCSLIDFQSLLMERDDYEIILQEIEDEDLWQQLPFHETLSGQWTAISEQCFLDNELDIPGVLEDQFVRIKKSLEEKIAEQQAKWIPLLDKSQLIRIILSSPNPYDYYPLILDQLLDISPEDDLFPLLKSTKWLISIDGKPIKPDDVIDIEGLAGEVKRLTAECNVGYSAPDDIHSDIRHHAAYAELKKLFACEKEGLDSLLLMLGESDDYAIGSLNFRVDELMQFAELVADDFNLPGWTLLANKKVRELLGQSVDSQSNPLKPLLNPLPVGAYQAVLNSIRQCHEQAIGNEKLTILKLFNAYLSLFALCPNALELLKEFKLLSQHDSWILSEQLCVDVEGVDDNALLNLEQARCLRAIIYSGKQSRIDTTQVVVADEMLLQSTSNTLKTYFKDWDGRVESELIGFFLSLLGDQPEIQQVAESFLGKRSIDGVRNEINWQVKRGEGRDKVTFDGLNQHEAIEKMEFSICVEDNVSINVNSIFNEPITVNLHSQPRTIIVNHSFAGQYGISFQVRQLNFSDLNESTLLNLLKNSANFILKTVYEQSINLEKIWADLGESDQLDIEVARGLILDELPANLRQLALQQSEIHKSLHDYHNAKSQKKELEITHGVTDAADKDIKYALQSMQDALTDDSVTQIAVLNAIKSKIANHQYQIYSVPFELFQNADDAVFEYAEMQAYPETIKNLKEDKLDAQQLQFQVFYDQKTLLFLHWGRAINYFRGSEGFPGKERGFHRDLEKMLLMNTSDKQAENQVTGKFGLGFKSVYLISDKPKILSGRLGVEIFAAMLPMSLQENDRSRLKSKIEQVSDTKLTATAIELPLSEEVDKETILRKFNCYAGVLVVFSKAIKSIVFNQKQNTSWHERPVFDDFPEIRRGNLTLGDKKVDAIKFVFSDEQFSCDLLFSFGATGFENFPYKIEQELLPKIWILAPVNDESSIGFMINAGFDVDMGRMQLAHKSKKNDQIILHVGRNLARVFGQLDVMITSDWCTVRKALSLASDVTPYRFWQSLWLVLVSSWVLRKDDNKIHQLVRAMLTSPDSSFIELLSTKLLLPNGLWGEFQQLLSLPGIKYTLKGVLSQEKFFKAGIKHISIIVHADEVILEQVKDELFNLLSETEKKHLRWITFDLTTLVEKTFPDKRVDLHAAASWGELLNKEMTDELEKTVVGKKEKQRLTKCLANFELMNQSGHYTSVANLLDSQYSEQEERLRAAFAPDVNILNTKYDQKATVFFHFSRQQMRAKPEQMMRWVLVATDLKKQTGVLLYLLNGLSSDALADQLRPRIADTWLSCLCETSPHFIGWSREDTIKVLVRKLGSDETMESVFNESENNQNNFLNPETVLTNIYRWWELNKDSYIKKYNKETYPNASFPMLHSGDVLNRDGWMTLFFLGSLHTVGRAKKSQHRSSIEHFKKNGWWDVFIGNNPRDAADEWMRVLDEYFEKQFFSDEYELWMMRFVILYRFACWLENYTTAWLSINNQKSSFSLNDVLNTGTSMFHAGGGVYAPRLSKALGIGANFIMRELVRNGVLRNTSTTIISEHCFVPSQQLRLLLNKIGIGLSEEQADVTQSIDIYKFICNHIGKDKATYDLSFDIPFKYISENPWLELQLFSNVEYLPDIENADLDEDDNNLKRLYKQAAMLCHPDRVSQEHKNEAHEWFISLKELFSNNDADSIETLIKQLLNLKLVEKNTFEKLFEENNLPEPETDYQVKDEQGNVKLILHYAWRHLKVGITKDNNYKLIIEAQKLDWKVFTFDEFEEELERFLACFG